VSASELALPWLQRWLQVEELRELGRLELEVHSETAGRIDFEVLEID
jgi:hypothetical protein